MKKRNLFIGAAVLATSSGVMPAQTPQAAGIVYQQAGVISVQSGAGGGAFTTMSLPVTAGSALLGPETVAGSPLSATHQSHSLQMLSDGTRIERDESQQIYRDSRGRTRVESGPSGSGTAMIQDPVSGVMAVLDAATKTAQKMPAPPMPKLLASSGNGATAVRTQQFAISTGAASRDTVIMQAVAPGGAASPAIKPITEDLPVQSVNGVMATGRKTILTIPAGEIGNDRPIQVVSETWYSSDLQMVVRSSNSDPRFGDTSVELTNINRNEPDPSLFQIPAEYTVTEPKTIHSRPMQPKE